MTGDHQVFVSPDYPHGAGTARSGNHLRMTRILAWVEGYNQMGQSSADFPAYRGGVFTDAACKDESIQTIERRGHCSYMFAKVITKQLNGLCCAWLLLALFQ